MVASSTQVAHAFPFRTVFRYEIEHLLARCGFRMAALFGDFDRSLFADAGSRFTERARLALGH